MPSPIAFCRWSKKASESAIEELNPSSLRKTYFSEGYGLQAVHKCFAMNPALAAEGTHFVLLPAFSATC